MIDDRQLQKLVLAELEWEPGVLATHIGVATHEGIVTLSGHVDSHAEKHLAEAAARRVRGVQAVVSEIQVKLPYAAERPDGDIAASIIGALRWQSSLPAHDIQVEVEKGRVTLYGTVEWEHQRQLAERIAGGVQGIRSLTSQISVKPNAQPAEVKLKIEQALKRSAEVEASHIEVSAHDGTVTLAGKVHSWHERQAAERAAWSAPGVSRVIDNIRIEHQANR